MPASSRARLAAALVLTVLLAIARTRHISATFWLLGDQIRDWGIALRPLTALPLVGPATHVHGYTIGPAFYWILWCIRVVVGPFFENLPHGGGIGQAILQSAVDGLLLVAIWKRTQSFGLGLAIVILLATAPFDRALSPVIWNPVVGSILAKAATALILLDWHRGSLARTAVTAGIAWCAVHSYTGAIFVALGAFAALLIDACVNRDWIDLRRRAAVIVGVVAALQAPYLIYQFSTGFGDSGMTAVTSSLAGMLTGREPLRMGASARFYIDAMRSIQAVPGATMMWAAILVLCASSLVVRYRRDVTLLTIALLPQAAAILGYGLWFADLDSYYYLSLAPAALLTVVLGSAAVVPRRAARYAGVAFAVGALALVPLRMREAVTLFEMPEYQALVTGSKEIAKRHEPMQSIRTVFELRPTSDPEFIFRILGGRIDRQASWRAVILADGRVEFQQVETAGI